MRQALLADLEGRVASYKRTSEPGVLFEASALAAADAAMRLIDQEAQVLGTEDSRLVEAVGLLLWYRYEASPVDRGHEIRGAIGLFRSIADDDLTRIPLPARPGALQARFELSRDVRDLDVLIAVLLDLIKPGADSVLGRITHLAHLGICLVRRFERLGARVDIEEAVGYLRSAVELVPTTYPARQVYECDLVSALGARGEATNSRADLDEATALGRKLVDDFGEGGFPPLCIRLARLGTALRARWDQTSHDTDLDDAIDFLRRAVAVLAADAVDSGEYYGNLSTALRIRFEHFGRDRDLDDAVQALRQAVASGAEDPFARARHLSRLSVALKVRFERTGQLGDIDDAVAFGRASLEPDSVPDNLRSIMLSDLGAALSVRYSTTRRDADLDEAIAVHKAAIELVSDESRARAMNLSNLGVGLHEKFFRTGETAYLDAAVVALDEAIGITAGDHPNRALYLSNLAMVQLSGYRLSVDRARLDGALQTMRAAVAATAPRHPERAQRMVSLASALMDAQDAQDAQQSSVAEALTLWREAAEMETANTQVRMVAATSGAQVSADNGDELGSISGMKKAVELLPRLAWHGLNRSTQEDRLAQWTALACDAAASALHAENRSLAVELLEHGRSVLWSHLLNARTELSLLEAKAPRLATRLRDIRRVLDRPFSDPSAVEVLAASRLEGGPVR